MSLSEFLPKRNYFRRVFTVSKVHQLAVSLLCILVILIFSELSLLHKLVVTGFTFFVVINNGRVIYRYTPIHSKELADGIQADLTIYALNVRQKNKAYQSAIESVKSVEADILVFTETDQQWTESLNVLEHDYPFRYKEPKQNTYGINLFSKLKIDHAETKYLVNPEVPSVHADIVLKDKKVRLIIIHPEPPLGVKRLKEKDLEIIMASMDVKDIDYPTIICGDLNDVGWSYASRHMCNETKLKDPRVGRGFFNTYNAHIPLFRYPIDHFFLSDDFKITEMKVLEKCGSDHFPVFIALELNDSTCEKKNEES